ncbi:MAG: flagellar hook-associated protein FlgK [Nitrospinae bacterium]|nr:flagellar hook-associated protein FlgK [Nitrospinota bacterium]
MNIYGAMNTAKWALLSAQTAIEVTGQNVANVNNPDFNRQTAILQAQYPVNQGNHFIGTGVTVAAVKRNFDQFLYNQQLSADFNQNNYQARETIMNRVDTIMNETSGSGINNAMSNFFQSYYNLAINPSGATERTDVVEKAKSLSAKVSFVAGQVQQTRRDTDLKITGAVPIINNITSQIAALNKVIHETESNGAVANDYRDRREGLIKQVASFMDIGYAEANNGEVSVYMKTGRPLVTGENNFTLSTKQNPSDPATSSVFWADSAGNNVNITSDISAGQMGAWTTLRDQDLIKVQNQLDSLSASIVRDVNRIHAASFGLDGSTGINFFNGLTPGGRASNLNTGTGTLQPGSVLNPDNINLDHYRITFGAGGSYTVNNIDKGTASGTFTFTAGSPLTFFQQRGISIAIAGAPNAGDSFDISGAFNAAFTLAVNPTVQNDLNKVAAGSTTRWGDGISAEAIGSLQYAKTIGGAWSVAGATSGVYTYTDFYGATVGGVGSTTQAAASGRKLAEAVTNQLNNLRQQSSGVALDEEMINLVKYQQAYGAAAKTITTIDEMLQTLLNIK